MNAPLLIRSATLPDGRTGIDLLALDGRIAALGPALPRRPGRADRRRRPAAQPAVRRRPLPPGRHAQLRPAARQASGTLLEGIALWGELKPLLTQEAIVERALQYCDWAVAQGLLAIRSHVDVCDARLLAVRALLDVQASAWRPTSTCSWWPSRRTACCARPARWRS